MGDFAIAGEGITDQTVLKNILQAWFEDRDLLVAFKQPDNDLTGQTAERPPGGWSPLIAYFKEQKFVEALQFNSYLVTQIDTDVAGEYGVDHAADDAATVEAVINKLTSFIPADIKAKHGHRFLFAIGHQSIECWLMPLLVDASQKAKVKKTVGCTAAANHEWMKKNNPALATTDHKDLDQYDALSSQFRKKKDVLKHCQHNAGFQRFVQHLEAVKFPDE